MKKTIFAVLIFALVAVSCSSPDDYKSVPADSQPENSQEATTEVSDVLGSWEVPQDEAIIESTKGTYTMSVTIEEDSSTFDYICHVNGKLIPVSLSVASRLESVGDSQVRMSILEAKSEEVRDERLETCIVRVSKSSVLLEIQEQGGSLKVINESNQQINTMVRKQ